MRIVHRRLKQTEILVWLTIIGVMVGSTAVVASEWRTSQTDEDLAAVEDNEARARVLADAGPTTSSSAPTKATDTATSVTTSTVALAASTSEVVPEPVKPAPAKPIVETSTTSIAPKVLPPKTQPPTTQPPTTPAPTQPPTTQPPETQPPTTQPPTTPTPTQPPTTQPPTTPAPTQPPTTQPPETQPPTTQPPTTPAPTQPPTTQPPTTQPPVTDPPDDGFASARINSFTLIDAKADVDLFGVSDGSTVSLDEVGNRLSVRANVNQDVGSVVWSINGRVFKVENDNPYALAGNNGSNYGSVKIRPGTYTFTAQMFSERRGRGEAGHAVSVTVTFN